MRRAREVLFSREELELLGDQPELLLIADAYAATQPRGIPRLTVSKPIGRRAAVVVAATLLGLSVVVSIGDGPRLDVLDRALAAVGSEPVLHSIVRTDIPEQTILDLSSGIEAPSVIERECWSDPERSLVRCVTRQNGVSSGADLVIGNRGTSSAGPIEIGQRPVRVEEAVAGFGDRYRAALQEGRARQDGVGEVGGVAVVWLTIRDEFGRRERVAVAEGSYRPIAFRSIGPRGEPGPLWAVAEIESLSRQMVPTLTESLEVVQPPSLGRILGSRPSTLPGAREALGGKIGLLDGGFQLVRVEVQDVLTAYGDGGTRSVDVGVFLTYSTDGERAPDQRPTLLMVREARKPQLAYRFPRTSTGVGTIVPPRSALIESIAGQVSAFLKLSGIYIAISGVTREDVVRAASTLYVR